jgi:hypothetical protein
MSVDVDFIRVEIQTGTTMLTIARTERRLRELEAATKAITNARTALFTAKRFLSRLKNVGIGTLSELSRSISELESAIREYDDDLIP